ncbi:helix-turn-helix domain-containing protein [Dokdonia sp.]|uniref:helix-turn-helix domain-containing protein n=1 Tax=Dokdonia sp. TaxID=2024995 RepID=UPI0032636579
MDFLDILLIIISSAGLIHGILFAVYLCFIKKKKTISNLLLGLMLIFMAFRIGKSVMLHFGHNLEPLFIFAGLAFLLLIGPLLRWYVLAMTRSNFKLPSYYAIEFIPFILVFAMSFFITKNWFDPTNRQAIIVFGSILIFIYLHFASYIFISGKRLQSAKKVYAKKLQTKDTKAIFEWLHILIIGFIIIWISYFLNIIEDTIPYIVGPIVYSIVIYFLSYKAYSLKITDIDGNVFKDNDHTPLYNRIVQLVVDDKLYLEPNTSLSSLSKLLGVSSQKTSKVINQHANRNFNDFINYYRIQDAKKQLLDVTKNNYTISSIAFDTGFSSLSSFNSAFKKFESTTPSLYKKENGN